MDVWRTCPSNGWILMTGNRNHDGPDSLEATILRESQPGSLPVFTIGNPKAVLTDSAYAVRVAVSALEYLMDGGNILGARRYCLPPKANEA